MQRDVASVALASKILYSPVRTVLYSKVTLILVSPVSRVDTWTKQTHDTGGILPETLPESWVQQMIKDELSRKRFFRTFVERPEIAYLLEHFVLEIDRYRLEEDFDSIAMRHVSKLLRTASNLRKLAIKSQPYAPACQESSLRRYLRNAHSTSIRSLDLRVAYFTAETFHSLLRGLPNLEELILSADRDGGEFTISPTTAPLSLPRLAHIVLFARFQGKAFFFSITHASHTLKKIRSEWLSLTSISISSVHNLTLLQFMGDLDDSREEFKRDQNLLPSLVKHLSLLVRS